MFVIQFWTLRSSVPLSTCSSTGSPRGRDCHPGAGPTCSPSRTRSCGSCSPSWAGRWWAGSSAGTDSSASSATFSQSFRAKLSFLCKNIYLLLRLNFQETITFLKVLTFTYCRVVDSFIPSSWTRVKQARQMFERGSQAESNCPTFNCTAVRPGKTSRANNSNGIV